MYKRAEEGTVKYREGITLSTDELEFLVDKYTKVIRLKKRKNCDVSQKLRKSYVNKQNIHARKRNARMKTMITVVLRNIFNSLINLKYTAMVEAMYEQSPDYFKPFRKE